MVRHGEAGLCSGVGGVVTWRRGGVVENRRGTATARARMVFVVLLRDCLACRMLAPLTNWAMCATKQTADDFARCHVLPMPTNGYFLKPRRPSVLTSSSQRRACPSMLEGGAGRGWPYPATQSIVLLTNNRTGFQPLSKCIPRDAGMTANLRFLEEPQSGSLYLSTASSHFCLETPVNRRVSAVCVVFV